MRFTSGPSNPSAKRSEVIRVRRASKKKRNAHAHRRKKEEELRLGIRQVDVASPAGRVAEPPMFPPRIGLPKSEAQRAMIRALHARGGVSQLRIAWLTGCSETTVSRVLRGVSGTTGKPRGRPMVTTREERDQLRGMQSKDPFGRYKDVGAEFKQQTGRTLTEAQVSAVLKYTGDDVPAVRMRASNRYTRLDLRILDMHLGFREGLMRSLAEKEVALKDLVYMDEFPVYYGIAARKGRTDNVQLYAEEENKRGAGRLNVLAAISIDGPLKVWVNPGNTNDVSFTYYMLQTQANTVPIRINRQTVNKPTYNLGGRPLPELMSDGQILLLDRLGRSGKSKNPKALHYNPKVRREFVPTKGYELLPPKGAEFNPIELFNGFCQRHVLHWQPPGGPLDAFGQKVRGPRNREECLMALDSAVGYLKDPDRRNLFRHWYHRRATGSDAMHRWSSSEAAMKYREEHPPAQLYNIKQRAFRQQLFNIHADDPNAAAGDEEEGDEEDDWPTVEEVITVWDAISPYVDDVEDVPLAQLARVMSGRDKLPDADVASEGEEDGERGATGAPETQDPQVTANIPEASGAGGGDEEDAAECLAAIRKVGNDDDDMALPRGPDAFSLWLNADSDLSETESEEE